MPNNALNNSGIAFNSNPSSNNSVGYYNSGGGYSNNPYQQNSNGSSTNVTSFNSNPGVSSNGFVSMGGYK